MPYKLNIPYPIGTYLQNYKTAFGNPKLDQIYAYIFDSNGLSVILTLNVKSNPQFSGKISIDRFLKEWEVVNDIHLSYVDYPGVIDSIKMHLKYGLPTEIIKQEEVRINIPYPLGTYLYNSRTFDLDQVNAYELNTKGLFTILKLSVNTDPNPKLSEPKDIDDLLHKWREVHINMPYPIGTYLENTETSSLDQIYAYTLYQRDLYTILMLDVNTNPRLSYPIIYPINYLLKNWKEVNIPDEKDLTVKEKGSGHVLKHVDSSELRGNLLP